MKLLTWNICHGGGDRISDIALVLTRKAPDVIALNEYRNARGPKLQSVLREHGWEYQAVTPVAGKVNGILIAAKTPFDLEPCTDVPEICRNRWLEVNFKRENLRLLAIHIPLGREKPAFWENTLRRAEQLGSLNSPVVILGDLNTGKPLLDEVGATLLCAECIEKLELMDWVDAWRLQNPSTREFTWYSGKGNGFRLDHAFLSPALAPRLRSVSYSHQERIDRISDHSMLLIEVDVTNAGIGDETD